MKPTNHLCQSCHCLVEEDATFCSVCGQKKIHATASLKELFGEFVTSLFSLDSKFIRTFIPLFFIPGKLTQEYFRGRRQLYYTPIRLFLFWMTVTLLTLNIHLSDYQKKGTQADSDIQLETYKDSIRQKLNLAFQDSISQQKIAQIILIDSLGDLQQSIINIKDSNNDFKIRDLYFLDSEEFIAKHELEGYWKQQSFRQFSKMLKNPGNFQVYLFSHLSWIILFSMPLIALLFKLLYVRQDYKYVEHLVHSLHMHTFGFIMATLLISYLFLNVESSIWLPILMTSIGVGLYFFVSVKRVYQQSIIKTIFKMFLFLNGYLLILLLAVILFLAINFFAF